MSNPPQSEARNLAVGAISMICAVGCFTALDSIMKHMVQTTNPFILIWGRMIMQVALMLALSPLLGGRQMFKARQPYLHLARGLSLASVSILVVLSLRQLPLTQVYVIGFAAPFIATMLAAAALSETVTPRQWLLIALGFSGVLIAMQPGAPDAGWHLIYPVGFAIANAVYFVLTRAGGQKENPMAQLFYVALFACLVLSLILPWSWASMSADQWLMLLAAGGLGTLGHLLLILAFRRGPTVVVAPMFYFQIIWSGLIGYLVFADLPSTATWTGAALIAASGIALMRARN